jgi:hypothetical protein
MASRKYNINVHIRINRMRNIFSKPREPNNENPTGYVQRDGGLGYEGKGKD